MPDSTPAAPNQPLQQWFQWLKAMQTACGNASQVTGSQSLAEFANSTISAILTDDLQTGTFLTALAGQMPFSFDAAQVAQSTTFESLLEKASTIAPAMLFAGLLSPCLNPPYNAMDMTTLPAVLLSLAFPQGKTDPAWSSFQAGLAASVECSCYTIPKQQNAVAALLTIPGSTVDDLLKQLVKFG